MVGRVFCCVMPTGISWSDRKRLVDGDYKRLAFLSFNTLELKVEPDCPMQLQPVIYAGAAGIQAQRGQPFQVSASGQTVILGG